MDETNNGKTDDAEAIAESLLIESTRGEPRGSSTIAPSDEESVSTERESVRVDNLAPDSDTQTGGKEEVPATETDKAGFVPNFTEIELSLEAFISAGETTKSRAGPLYVLTPCKDLSHTPVWTGDVKGYFKLSSADLSKLRPQGISHLADHLATDIGCGYEDCSVTHEDALGSPEQTPDQIYCSGYGTDRHLYDWDQLGCDRHEETNTVSIIVALVSLSKQYSAQITNVMRAGYAVPNLKVLGTPNAKNLEDGTSKPLTGNGTAVDLSTAIFWGTLLQSSLEQVALSDRPVFIPSTEKLYKQLKTAKEVVKGKSTTQSMAEADTLRRSADSHRAVQGWNVKLRGVKRKVCVENFTEETRDKFRKLEQGKKVHGTKKSIELSIGDYAGLNSAYTDMCATQNPRTVVFTVNTNAATDIQAWTETHTSLVTASWEGPNFQCTNCTTGHTAGHSLVVKNGVLCIAISDQHAPARLDSPDELCIASYRMSNSTMRNFNTHLFNPMLKANGMAVDAHRYGVVDLIQRAMSVNMRIYMSVSSGTSLIEEGPAGYIQGMQDVLAFVSNRYFEQQGAKIFGDVSFPAPLLPYLRPAQNGDTAKSILPKLRLEATLLARQIAVNSRPKVCSTFDSATEYVGVQLLNRASEAADIASAMTWAIPSKITNYRHAKDGVQINQLRICTKKSHWMKENRSNIGLKLSLVALTEYTRAQYVDFYRARRNVEKRDFKELRSMKDYLQMRYAFPNVLLTTCEWNGMVSAAEPDIHVCVNPLKHTQVLEFKSNAKAQAHRTPCIPDNGQ